MMLQRLFREESFAGGKCTTVVVLNASLGFPIFLDLPLLLDAHELFTLDLGSDQSILDLNNTLLLNLVPIFLSPHLGLDFSIISIENLCANGLVLWFV